MYLFTGPAGPQGKMQLVRDVLSTKHRLDLHLISFIFFSVHILVICRLLEDKTRNNDQYTRGHLHYINDGANAPLKKKGEVFLRHFQNLGEISLLLL